MKIYSPFVLFIFLACAQFNTQAQDKGDYELVWADEFEYEGEPDPSKWAYETGYLRNVEDQYYTKSTKNARVEDGNLILEARKERVKNDKFQGYDKKNWIVNRDSSEYTSASIHTNDKGEWTYGLIEVKAKLPEGVGLWPAIWMLGDNISEVGWPDSGEIDIMEHVGFEKDSVFGTVHTKAFNHMIGTQKGKKIFIDKPYTEYHTYAIEWTPEKIDFFVDGVRYNHFQNEHKTTAEWPFDQPFYLKLNIAVGGMLGGKKGIDDSIFPQKMLVDYVRVYQKK